MPPTLLLPLALSFWAFLPQWAVLEGKKEERWSKSDFLPLYPLLLLLHCVKGAGCSLAICPLCCHCSFSEWRLDSSPAVFHTPSL